jgi:hypothetical protein
MDASSGSGAIDVLVATTVIEVGVDVPNATVMVILDADRFGIAQLHQLRGRVGRGAAARTATCSGTGATPRPGAPLEAMVETTDGFELAEVDLDLRGEGTILGERQKGRNDLFKLASLRRPPRVGRHRPRGRLRAGRRCAPPIPTRPSDPRRQGRRWAVLCGFAAAPGLLIRAERSGWSGQWSSGSGTIRSQRSLQSSQR